MHYHKLLLAKQGLLLRKLPDHPLDLLQIIFSAARRFFILSRLLWRPREPVLWTTGKGCSGRLVSDRVFSNFELVSRHGCRHHPRLQRGSAAMPGFRG